MLSVLLNIIFGVLGSSEIKKVKVFFKEGKWVSTVEVVLPCWYFYWQYSLTVIHSLKETLLFFKDFFPFSSFNSALFN